MSTYTIFDPCCIGNQFVGTLDDIGRVCGSGTYSGYENETDLEVAINVNWNVATIVDSQ